MTLPIRPDPDAARDLVAALLRALGATAAGLWWVRGDRLVQGAFVPSPTMPAEVAASYAVATRSISLEQGNRNLGVVRAVLTDAVAVTVAEHAPAEAGSGFWLRSFGAARSVAVPLREADGRVAAILSVALPSADAPDDQAVAEVVRAHGAALVS